MREIIFAAGLWLGAIVAIIVNGPGLDTAARRADWVELSKRVALSDTYGPSIVRDAYFSRSGGLPVACGTILYSTGFERRYIFTGTNSDVLFESADYGFEKSWSALCKKK